MTVTGETKYRRQPVLRLLVLGDDRLAASVTGDSGASGDLPVLVSNRAGGAVELASAHWRTGGVTTALAELERRAAEIASFDVAVMSIEADVRDGTRRDDYLTTMAEILARLKAAGCHVLILNGSSVDPSGVPSCYSNIPTPPSLTVQELNLAVMHLSVLDGISIIDADRVLAELGAERHVQDLLTYSPEALRALRDEVVRVLDDYGFFEERPLVAQVGRRGR